MEEGELADDDEDNAQSSVPQTSSSSSSQPPTSSSSSSLPPTRLYTNHSIYPPSLHTLYIAPLVSSYTVCIQSWPTSMNSYLGLLRN